MAEFEQKTELTVNPNAETVAILVKTDSKQSPTSPLSSSRKYKKVSFSSDTALPKDDNIALTISKHAYTKELGYTQYTITLLFRGSSWVIYKRYRDFEDFHRRLLTENDIMQIVLPALPQKRWFERQRWFNRFDESYGTKRRIALQDYLRCITKIPQIKERSLAFLSFLEMPPDVKKVYLSVIQEDSNQKSVGEEKYEGVVFFRDEDPVEGLKSNRNRYRDSILEVELNTEFDDEGRRIFKNEGEASEGVGGDEEEERSEESEEDEEEREMWGEDSDKNKGEGEERQKKRREASNPPDHDIYSITEEPERGEEGEGGGESRAEGRT